MKKVISPKKFLGIFIPAIAMALIVGIICICMVVLRREVRNEVRFNLLDVAEQNGMLIKNRIDDNFELLDRVEKQLRTPDDDVERIKRDIVNLKPVVEANGLFRIVFCDTKGDAYTTDMPVGAEPTNLSFRPFFQAGMQGKSFITGRLVDALGPDNNSLNVISKPMIDAQGNVFGVLDITFYSEEFNSALQVSSFDGKGYGCAVESDGLIVVAADEEGSYLDKNLFTDVLEKDARNAEAIVNLRAALQSDATQIGSIYLVGNQSIYACRPLKLLSENENLDDDITWHIISFVRASYLNERIDLIDRTLVLLMVMLVLIIAAAVISLTLLTSKQRHTLTQLAYVDPVTQGNNFAAFKRHLRFLKPQEGVFLAVDIADFKTLNVAVGVEAGNAVLKEMYTVLAGSLNDGECVARVAQDHFAVFLSCVQEDRIAGRVHGMTLGIEKISERLGVPSVRPRFGIYHANSDADVDAAYGSASQAAEVVKQNDELVYSFYSSEDNQRLLMERALLDGFDDALLRGEFIVYYQPKYSAATQKPVGAEALVQWQHGERRITAGEFIPLLEKHGRIVRLDEYMFRAVCKQQKQWLSEGKTVLPVSVNLSRATLYYENVAEKYLRIVNALKLDPAYVQLEVTETAVRDNANIDELINAFRSMGVKILMDDFGAGYSSLSLLSTDSFDTLKIDKSLIDTLGTEKGDLLLENIMRMAKNLGFNVTAEGVETKEQFTALRDLQCDDIQGFYFSRPLPKEEYEKLL